jgi:hypothetical protein
MKTYTATFNITLTQEEVSSRFGFLVPDEEWDGFCKAFHEFFQLEHDATLEWLVSEWETEVKDDYINQ